MTKEVVPVPLVLDLWSLGHSAGDIAKRVGIPRKRVTLIVAEARSISDPRAVLHCGTNGRLLGRPGRDGTKIRRGAKTVHRTEVAMLISKAKPKPEPKPKAAFCCNGHPRIPENVGSQRNCLVCRSIKAKAKRAAAKEAS